MNIMDIKFSCLQHVVLKTVSKTYSDLQRDTLTFENDLSNIVNLNRPQDSLCTVVKGDTLSIKTPVNVVNIISLLTTHP